MLNRALSGIRVYMVGLRPIGRVRVCQTQKANINRLKRYVVWRFLLLRSAVAASLLFLFIEYAFCVTVHCARDTKCAAHTHTHTARQIQSRHAFPLQLIWLKILCVALRSIGWTRITNVTQRKQKLFLCCPLARGSRQYNSIHFGNGCWCKFLLWLDAFDYVITLMLFRRERRRGRGRETARTKERKR